jgi:hypothetical protein
MIWDRIINLYQPPQIIAFNDLIPCTPSPLRRKGRGLRSLELTSLLAGRE